jgi:hypothetical protein
MEVACMDANWVIAIMTIFYTIGTFLLWWVTRQNIKQAEESFKLNVLVSLMNINKPVYGMKQKYFDSYEKLSKAIKMPLDELVKKNFPKGYEMILSYLKQS